MSKVIIKKEDEILTLLDEIDIQNLIDTTNQKVRVGHLYGSSHSNSAVFVEAGNADMTDLTDWTPLTQTDIVLVQAPSSGCSMATIYAKDDTTILASLDAVTKMGRSTWGVLIYIAGTVEEWVLLPITEWEFSTQRIRNPGALSNLGTNADATQSRINTVIDSKFGDLESNTLTVTITYTDNSTETVTLYKQAPQQS